MTYLLQDDFNIYIYNYFIIRIDELITFDCSKSNNSSVDHINHWYLLIFFNHADTLAHYKNTSALTQILEHECITIFFILIHMKFLIKEDTYVLAIFIIRIDVHLLSLHLQSITIATAIK